MLSYVRRLPGDDTPRLALRVKQDTPRDLGCQ